MWVTRHLVDDGARYFGPYTDVGAMRRALNVVKRIFTVRSCNYDMPRANARAAVPRLLHQAMQGPVHPRADAGRISRDDRRGAACSSTERPQEVVRRVRERMDSAAESLDFERAAELRDALQHLEQMEEPTVVLEIEGGDRDVVGYARDGDDAVRRAACAFAAASCSRASTSFVENLDEEDDADVLQAYLVGKYLPLEDSARRAPRAVRSGERELVETSLERTKIHVPQRGPRRELVDLATQNARHLLEELRLTSDEAEERAGDPVYELQRQLGLQKVPRSLVCFDISHAQGTDTVASCVWFQNGRPYRAEYRKFKVKTVEGIDDFASMNEVVSRYFTRRLNEEKPLPDLVVIDGGKGS